ncbi:hypothetical protein [Romboutsia sp.]|uniref:hypothetical protein n=1 Tax=Romboutsia sp. TaxID=1965302 RepID=UPI002BAE1B37|nr:hypothetical protein [Romboutsia sp.]HSQ90208.1 hypothetical protein [Romboutsia sp.]
MFNILLVVLLGLILVGMVKQDRDMKHIKEIQERQAKRLERLEEKRLDYALLRQRIETMDREYDLFTKVQRARDISIDVDRVCNPIGFDISNITVEDMINQVNNTYKEHGIDVSYEEIVLRE